MAIIAQSEKKIEESKEENEKSTSPPTKEVAFFPPPLLNVYSSSPLPCALQGLKEEQDPMSSEQGCDFPGPITMMTLTSPKGILITSSPNPNSSFPSGFNPKEQVDKKRHEECKTVALTEKCNAILQKKLPPKLDDPGSFAIPCIVGNCICTNAMCDLGSAINLICYLFSGGLE